MKSKIIEVIGPPGVGKSTIYEALCATWTPSCAWIYQEELLARPKPSITQLSAWLEYNLRKIMAKPKVKSIPVEYGLRFSNSYKELANFCWEYLTDSDMPLNRQAGNRFRSSYFLFNDFCRYQAILERINGVPCLLQEGFLQKSFLLHESPQTIKSTLQTYLSLIPVPSAILLIDTSEVDIIVERLILRKKVIASHMNADAELLTSETKKWRQLLLTSVAALEQNGVQVYHLDASRPVRENVALARQYLNSI
ncbi:hypothetical protein [Pontibacter indicus]|uniref:Thymidylate kinase n=1 Tax=Pontibacter indicus TaxID=1317125 RepID=A0A1R3WEB9_9BACT|nr:hypothetical protein [Pontibacter indicus]SIT75506.1 hypothetical protein SAMN05444128_0218 [Pontibacter indicus]